MADTPVAVTTAKMASLPQILKAAQLLYELGLQSEQPNETVKRYVLANPDINKFLARQGMTPTVSDKEAR